MPKQTFTIGDFSGGMNRHSDPLDLIQKRQVPFCVNGHFDTFGKIVYQGDTPAGSDLAIRNDSSDPTIADLDTQIGGAGGDNLGVNVAAVTTATDDLSWEDGIYDFKYTVCKDLGNGIIEEGSLQAFQDATIDSVACDATSVNMNADDLGKFTFKHEGQTFPSWKAVGSIIGRVYYSRQSGQGASSQVGWIHLCDLIYGIDSGDHDRIRPRAVGLTGNPANNIIDIEEPPTSASFEMNAGYPSEVGIHDAVGDFGDDILAVVSLGMVKYIAATKDSKYYIYKSLPGQPDIWPTDNWVEMPEACVNMIGIRNHLCYWSTTSFIAFDVIQEAIVGHMGGLGLAHSQTAAKCGDAALWAVGSNTAYTKVYSFNGQLKEIGKSRIQGVNGQVIKFYDDSGWIYFDSVTGTYDNVYSTVTDTWFVLNYAGGETRSVVYMPMVDFGELGRFKKIYSFTIMGGIGHVDSDTAIVHSIVDEDFTKSLTSSFTAGTFDGSGYNGSITYTANPPVKVKAIQVVLNFQEAASSPAFDAARAEIHGISFVYRKVGT